MEPRRQAHPAAGPGQARPRTADSELSDDDHEKNNLPDILLCWAERDGAERERARTEQSFCVPKEEIAANAYDLSINRYKEIVHEEVEIPPPVEIVAELERLEDEIRAGLEE